MPKTLLHTASVCDTGHTTPSHQIADRHVGTTRADTALTPEIAREIITTYTAPGDTVCDPNPGPGLVLAEALRAGRDALGLPTEPRWEAALTTPLRGNRVRPRAVSRAGPDPESTDMHGHPTAFPIHLDMLFFHVPAATHHEAPERGIA